MSEVADGPEMKVSGRRWSSASATRASASGRSSTICGSLDDADVEVGDERERAAALGRPGREDDRPGLGDRDGAARDGAVDQVEVAWRQLVVLDELDVGAAPGGREPAGRDQPRRATRRADRTDHRRELGLGHAPHLCAILAHSPAEELDTLVCTERSRAPVAASRR